MKLTPVPCDNIIQIKKAPYWQVVDLPARVMLLPEDGRTIPAGWLLLKGELHRRSQDFSASLIVEFEDSQCGEQSFPLPVTRKGTLLELIHLPPGVVRLTLEPMRSRGEVSIAGLSLTAVGHLERLMRMWRRVLPLYVRYPREVRRRAGLRLYTPFIDLQQAYRIAGVFRTYSPTISYSLWLEKFDRVTVRERWQMRRLARHWKRPPRIEAVILARGDSPATAVEATVASLKKQILRPAVRRLTFLPARDGGEGTVHIPAGVEVGEFPPCADAAGLRPKGKGSAWTLIVGAGCALAPHAGFWFASAILRNAAATFIYADHDHLDADGERYDPEFKPDWSLELLRSANYIGAVAAIRNDVLALACAAGGAPPTSLHDLWLRVGELAPPGSVYHIPAVLAHQPPAVVAPAEDAAAPVADHLRRSGVAATVTPLDSDRYRVRYRLPDEPPLVSIVVPTRDALHHLQPCLDSVLSGSTYRRFELIVVDNQSSDPATLAYLQGMERDGSLRVLRFDRPFNYSAMNNLAAREARGEILCLLNNDTAVITPDWLEEMLGHLLQPGVGVVGAKLLYADGRVQHGGDTVGPGGCADHLHSFIERDAPGYCGRALLAQDLSAVTAACLLTRRALYLDLGGLDEINLPVSFNDVDYCLRVREAGQRVIWTPHAELYHFESATRGKDVDPESLARARREANYMRRRWKHLMKHDPFYNPNLSYDRPDFSLSNAPLVRKPWLKPS